MIEQILADLGHLFDPAWWHANGPAVVQVIIIDLVLAGDNAIVVGLAASRVAPEVRAKTIFWGIAAAVLLRIAFAAVALQLLNIVGLMLAGGILLLWVCWKLYRQASENHLAAEGTGGKAPADHHVGFWTAVAQIAIADISMSLDNVLAVTGVAKVTGAPGESLLVLVIGLTVAIILMAVASHMVAALLVRYPWITWIGLVIILWVAVDMIFRGSQEVMGVCDPPQLPCQGVWERLMAVF